MILASVCRRVVVLWFGASICAPAVAAVDSTATPAGFVRLAAQALDAWPRDAMHASRAELLGPDAAQAVTRLETRAAAGDDWARYRVGQAWLHGWGRPVDIGRATGVFREAAERGNPLAAMWLAALHDGAKGAPRDPVEFARWNARLLALHESRAAQRLAPLPVCELNVGCTDEFEKPPHFHEALTAYERAAQSGGARAWALLADVHFSVERSFETALPWLRKAAEAGDAEAQRSLGTYHFHGFGSVPVDHEQAEAWLSRAAAQGGAEERRALAVFHRMARQDEARFRQQMLALAEEGDGEAQLSVAYWLANMDRTPQAIGQARDWASKALAQRTEGAHHALGDVERAAGNDREAFEWYRKGAAAGEVQSMEAIASAYQVGWFVPVDFEVSGQWHARADVADPYRPSRVEEFRQWRIGEEARRQELARRERERIEQERQRIARAQAERRPAAGRGQSASDSDSMAGLAGALLSGLSQGYRNTGNAQRAAQMEAMAAAISGDTARMQQSLAAAQAAKAQAAASAAASAAAASARGSAPQAPSAGAAYPAPVASAQGVPQHPFPAGTSGGSPPAASSPAGQGARSGFEYGETVNDCISIDSTSSMANYLVNRCGFRVWVHFCYEGPSVRPISSCSAKGLAGLDSVQPYGKSTISNAGTRERHRQYWFACKDPFVGYQVRWNGQALQGVCRK